MSQKIDEISERNLEILENLFKEMQAIIYKGRTKNGQMKMLYSARYWAKYMMRINNTILLEHFSELQKKQRCDKSQKLRQQS